MIFERLAIFFPSPAPKNQTAHLIRVTQCSPLAHTRAHRMAHHMSFIYAEGDPSDQHNPLANSRIVVHVRLVAPPPNRDDHSGQGLIMLIQLRHLGYTPRYQTEIQVTADEHQRITPRRIIGG